MMRPCLGGWVRHVGLLVGVVRRAAPSVPRWVLTGGLACAVGRVLLLLPRRPDIPVVYFNAKRRCEIVTDKPRSDCVRDAIAAVPECAASADLMSLLEEVTTSGGGDAMVALNVLDRLPAATRAARGRVIVEAAVRAGKIQRASAGSYLARMASDERGTTAALTVFASGLSESDQEAAAASQQAVHDGGSEGVAAAMTAATKTRPRGSAELRATLGETEDALAEVRGQLAALDAALDLNSKRETPVALGEVTAEEVHEERETLLRERHELVEQQRGSRRSSRRSQAGSATRKSPRRRPSCRGGDGEGRRGEGT